MTVTLHKTQLSLPFFTVHAFALIPDQTEKRARAVFSHGYTSHKSDCLPWAIRLAEGGVPTIIFDWPGHFLGSFNEAESFPEFQAHAHELFAEAWQRLEALVPAGQLPSPNTAILGGHSLGALLSLKALKLPAFQNYQRLGIAVGFGLNPTLTSAMHVFETSFYQKTLSIRRQLVSPALDSSVMFPWIKEEKERLDFSGERIHLITGADDLVVGAGGMEDMRRHLSECGNTVTAFEPTKLPHHEPTLAAPHLWAFLKQEYSWK